MSDSDKSVTNNSTMNSIVSKLNPAHKMLYYINL